MNLPENIRSLKNVMNEEGICPENGLGKELFCFASTLMPVVNVDLLILNKKKEILLSWRDDPHCGTGWHIPGGCIRFREKASERIQKTAMSEIGTWVDFSSEPIKVFEFFSKNDRPGIKDQRERAHFISLVYLCTVPKDYFIPKEKQIPGKAGTLKWFTELPENLIQIQNCYRKIWKAIRAKILEG